MQGYKQIVQYLIEKGADVNAKDKDFNTPLANACFNGHYSCTVLLCDAGARIKHKNRKTTALHHAAFRYFFHFLLLYLEGIH